MFATPRSGDRTEINASPPAKPSWFLWVVLLSASLGACAREDTRGAARATQTADDTGRATDPAPASPAATGTETGDAPAALDVAPTSLLDAVDGICKSATVQGHIAATFPGDMAPEARAALIEERRMRLRPALKGAAMKRSFDVEDQLLPYTTLGGAEPAPLAAVPERCDYFEQRDPAFWAAQKQRHDGFAGRQAQLAGLADTWWVGDTRGMNGDFAVVVYHAYLAAITDFLVHDGWKDGRLRPAGVSSPPRGLPPIYPIDRTAGIAATAQDGLERIYAQFPLLKRPGTTVLGATTESVGRYIFRHAFVTDRQAWTMDEVKDQLVRDLAPAISGLYEEHAAMSETELYRYIEEHGYALPPDVTPADYTLDQRRYLLVWQRFLAEQLQPMVAVKTVAALEQQTELRPLVAARLRQAANDWLVELGKARTQLCRDSDHEIESDPYILALYLTENQSPEVYELLDGYCNSRWSQNWDTMLDAGLRVAGYATILAGMAFAAPITIGALPFNLVAAAGGALVSAATVRDVLRSYDNLNLHSALYAPSIAERNWNRAGLAAQTAMVPATIILAGAVTGKLAEQTGGEGWRMLIPWFRDPIKAGYYAVPMGMTALISSKKYLDAGKNPLTQVSFFTDLAATHLMLLVSVNSVSNLPFLKALIHELVFGTTSGILAFMALDDMFRNIFFLTDGTVTDDRFRRFLAMWVPTGSAGNVAVLLSTIHLIDFVATRAGAAPRSVVTQLFQALWKVLQGYVYGNFAYATAWRYMVYTDLSLWEAVTQIQPDDFKLWMKNDICDPPKSEAARRACAALTADRFTSAGPDGQLIDLSADQLQDMQSLLRHYSPEGQPVLDTMMKAQLTIRRQAEAQAAER
jgi:hypothetical protein